MAQAEQKPRIDLYATVTIFTGTVTTDVILIRIVTYTVEVVFRIFINEFSEDTKAVAFEEKLRFYHYINATFEHIGYGHRQYRA